ncbi:chromatin assembly factor 1 subunit A-B [Aplysia californica]|uniref:Chromatin assembly factor 1 subunit A-B n=1 Tax=Aplysia californica TaxID=6500 RepID=A0ABM1AD52_APLCA|nr:chromatin assembly factor 1 subunit A-B [Aplysia californica]
MESLEENVPPPKKLKQAKLSFFKVSTASDGKLPAPTVGQGKKRKIPSVGDSPNKAAKLSKPLVSAVINAESPNAKVSKVTSKSVQSKKIEENDHEVSSSSEADASSGKSNGKCCLMERFVLKLPQDVQHEISSTNEVLDISADLTGESSKISLDEKDGDKEPNEADCILVEDDDCESENDDSPKQMDGQDNVNKEAEKVGKANSKCDESDDKKILSESDVKSEGSSTTDLAGPVAGTESESDNKAVHDDTVLPHDSCTPRKDLIEGAAEGSVLSPKTSTPMKDAASVASSHKELDSPQSQDDSAPGSAGGTPLSASMKKRGRKIDLEKKAEREALKQKVKEEKEKAREERKKKLDEEKAKKELERKEKKEAKDKEKQEQKEKLEKERLEKLKVKEDEKKQKEEERLKKEEEKKKIIEAKQEEKRKKEEEKRLKEEEKLREEEEKKKQAEKRKQAFQSFFIKPKESEPKPAVSKSNESMFIPFEVKKDMHLAPAVRNSLSNEKRNKLDQQLQTEQPSSVNYLTQLKEGDINPHKTGRVVRKNPEPAEDVEIVHDSEALKKVFHKVKILKFHTDYRPPYRGTWRKRPSLSPRNPWKKDEATFDYEVDSDEEWEEEEPGESLSCSDGEEEKGEEAEDEDDDGDGWMVPHGYLSEDEGCNEDDEITPEKLKLQQQAKAKAWEEEQKRKLQALPLIAVGCFFEHSPSPSMSGDVRLLYEFRGVILAPVVPIPTNQNTSAESEEPCLEQEGSTPASKGREKMAVPDDAMPDLIHLLHGNTCGIKRLVREFRVFWMKKNNQQSADTDETMNESATENADVSVLSDSVADVCADNEDKEMSDKPGDKEGVSQPKREEGYGCSISKRQLEIKIMSIAVREKRPGSKICWYVNDDVLAQYAMTDITLPNMWVFLTTGPTKSSPTPNLNKSLNTSKSDAPEVCEEEKNKTPFKPSNDQKSIMAFTMSKEELEKRASMKQKQVGSDSGCESKAASPVRPCSVVLKQLDSGVTSQAADNKRPSVANDASVHSLNGLPQSQGPSAEKKPKMSIMEMFLKKPSSSKKKLEKSFPDAQQIGENKADSDVEIIEECAAKVMSEATVPSGRESAVQGPTEQEPGAGSSQQEPGAGSGQKDPGRADDKATTAAVKSVKEEELMEVDSPDVVPQSDRKDNLEQQAMEVVSCTPVSQGELVASVAQAGDVTSKNAVQSADVIVLD